MISALCLYILYVWDLYILQYLHERDLEKQTLWNAIFIQYMKKRRFVDCYSALPRATIFFILMYTTFFFSRFVHNKNISFFACSACWKKKSTILLHQKRNILEKIPGTFCARSNNGLLLYVQMWIENIIKERERERRRFYDFRKHIEITPRGEEIVGIMQHKWNLSSERDNQPLLTKENRV